MQSFYLFIDPEESMNLFEIQNTIERLAFDKTKSHR